MLRKVIVSTALLLLIWWSQAMAVDSIAVFVSDATSKDSAFLNEVTQVGNQTGKAVEIINVELNLTLEAKLSEGLPAKEQDALVVAQQRFNDPKYRQTIKGFEQGLNNYLRVIEANIQAVPAVLFDNEYIVYGEAPVRSLEIYQAYQRRRN